MLTSSHAPHAEILPFSVRIAHTGEELAALCSFRTEAYARHAYLDAVPERLRTLDAHDLQSFLLIAQCKSTGDCIGTLRVSEIVAGAPPMSPRPQLGVIEGCAVAYLDRFAVAVAPGHALVRMALMKAAWLISCAREVEWMVASALAPLVRLYRGVGLRPVQGAEEGAVMPSMHETALYYLLGSRTDDLFTTLARDAPDRLRFFVATCHQDIEVAWPPHERWLQLRSPVATEIEPASC